MKKEDLLGLLAFSAVAIHAGFAAFAADQTDKNVQWNEPRVLGKIPVCIDSLSQLKKDFGHVVSDITASGKSRLKNGTLVSSEEWAGLKTEPLADTISFVESHSQEQLHEFGSLRATFFSHPNDLTRAVIDTALNAIVGKLPMRISPFDGYSLWMRSISPTELKSLTEISNAVGWHAHPDAGIYLHLLGKKHSTTLIQKNGNC